MRTLARGRMLRYPADDCLIFFSSVVLMDITQSVYALFLPFLTTHLLSLEEYFLYMCFIKMSSFVQSRGIARCSVSSYSSYSGRYDPDGDEVVQ